MPTNGRKWLKEWGMSLVIELRYKCKEEEEEQEEGRHWGPEEELDVEE